MDKNSRRFFLAGTASCLALGIDRFSSAQAQSGEINLYSARHYDTDNTIYQNFTQSTGIKVNLIEAKAEELIARIQGEGQNSPADLIVTVDAGNLFLAQQQGILQPVRSVILEKDVAANLRDPQGHWFGLTKRARVIVYNKEKVKPSELSTYEDLANPKWKGRFIIRSSNNIYNQSLMGSIIAANGKQKAEAWVKGVVANFAQPPKGNDTAQIKSVASGQGDLTLVNTYYVVRLFKSKKAEDQEVASKIGVFFPNQKDRGTHVNISGAGVVKTAPNKEGAIKFIEYLSSRQAQDIFARSNNEYPVTKGVSLDSVLRGFGQFKEDQINAVEFAKLNGEAVRMMDRGGWK